MPLAPRLRALAAAGLLAVGALLTPGQAWAQGGCESVSPTRSAQSFAIPGEGTVWYFGRPTFRCGGGVRIQADTAVAWTAQNMTHLMGNVRFVDGGKLLTADEARYFTRQGRLHATGNTLLRDTAQGSEIRHGDMILLRANDIRDADQITVTPGFDQIRPVAILTLKPRPDTATVVPGTVTAVAPDTAAPDTAAAVPPTPRRARSDTVRTPYTVEGERIFLQGDSYFLATGDVVIVRDSLHAYADSAEYDQVAERMILSGSARLEGDSYDLEGRTINIALPGGDMESVRAVRQAVLTGDDLRLEAPLIQVFMLEGAMERLVAVPLPGDPLSPPRTAADSADLAQPVAEAQDFRLTADSVEVQAPGEVLKQIFAAGSARGESSARDSLNVPDLPEEARKDWLEGDTIIATFSKVELEDLPPGDTITDEYKLDELRAMGSAKSLYRMLPSDSTLLPGVDAPAVHYVTGKTILIVMLRGEVDRMEVEGPTRGWHLEPERVAKDSAAADSMAAPPDTGGVRPDTASAAPATVAGAGGRERAPDLPDETDAALPGVAPGQRARGRRSGR
ncbi:MAG: hypothetical protein AMXMBFR53_06460 [Gemmatimonadota bacterium]